MQAILDVPLFVNVVLLSAGSTPVLESMPSDDGLGSCSQLASSAQYTGPLNISLAFNGIAASGMHDITGAYFSMWLSDPLGQQVSSTAGLRGMQIAKRPSATRLPATDVRLLPAIDQSPSRLTVNFKVPY